MENDCCVSSTKCNLQTNFCAKWQTIDWTIYEILRIFMTMHRHCYIQTARTWPPNSKIDIEPFSNNRMSWCNRYKYVFCVIWTSVNGYINYTLKLKTIIALGLQKVICKRKLTCEMATHKLNYLRNTNVPRCIRLRIYTWFCTVIVAYRPLKVNSKTLKLILNLLVITICFGVTARNTFWCTCDMNFC